MNTTTETNTEKANRLEDELTERYDYDARLYTLPNSEFELGGLFDELAQLDGHCSGKSCANDHALWGKTVAQAAAHIREAIESRIDAEGGGEVSTCAPDLFGFAPPACPMSYRMGIDEKGGLVFRAQHGGKLGLTHGDLLTSTPDLLAALVGMLRRAERDPAVAWMSDPDCAAARAAIAKATPAVNAPYTPAQVLASLAEINLQLDTIGGLDWIRAAVGSILERGIATAP